MKFDFADYLLKGPTNQAIPAGPAGSAFDRLTPEQLDWLANSGQAEALQRRNVTPSLPPPGASPEMRNLVPGLPQLPMTQAIPRAATSGVKRLAGYAELYGDITGDDLASEWARRQLAEGKQAAAEAHAGDDRRGFLPRGAVGMVENLPSQLPSYAALAAGGGPLGYALGNLAAVGPIYGGTEGPLGRRLLSAGAQAGIEAVDPTALILARLGMGPMATAGAAYAGNVAAETGQEPFQRLVGEKIEKGIPFSQDTGRRMSEEFMAALPTTTLMGVLPGLAGALPQQKVSRGTQGELDIPKGRLPLALRQKMDIIAPVTTGIHNASPVDARGSSVNPHTGKPVRPGRPGYGVGLFPDRSLIVGGKTLSRKQVGDYVASNWDIFSKDRNLFVGTWTDNTTGETFLDVSGFVPDYDTAMRIARENGERAIWDFQNMREIRVSEAEDTTGWLPGMGPADNVGVSATWSQQTPKWEPYKVPGSGEVGLRSSQPGGHNVTVAPKGDKWVIENFGSVWAKAPTLEAAQARAEDLISALPTPRNQPPTSRIVPQAEQATQVPTTPIQPLAPHHVEPTPPPRPVVDAGDPRLAEQLRRAAAIADTRLEGPREARALEAYEAQPELPPEVAAGLTPLKTAKRDYGFPVWDFTGDTRFKKFQQNVDPLTGKAASHTGLNRLTDFIYQASRPGILPYATTSSDYGVEELREKDPEYLNVLLSRAVSAYYGDKPAAAMLQMAEAQEPDGNVLEFVRSLNQTITNSAYVRARGFEPEADARQGLIAPLGEVPPLGLQTDRNDPQLDQTYESFRRMNSADEMGARQMNLPGTARDQRGNFASPYARWALATDKGPFSKKLADPATKQRLIDLAREGEDVGVGWWKLDEIKKDYGADWPLFVELWAASNQMNSPGNAFAIASAYFKRYKAWEAAGKDPARLDEFIPAKSPFPTGEGSKGSGNLPGIVKNARAIVLGEGMSPSEEKLTSMPPNVHGDPRPVVIDRWIARAIHGPADWSTMRDENGKKIPDGLSREQYGPAEKFMQDVADEIGMNPDDFQASVWVGALRRALDAGWVGASKTSLAGATDQYLGRVRKTAAETGLTEDEVRQLAGTGQLELREPDNDVNWFTSWMTESTRKTGLKTTPAEAQVAHPNLHPNSRDAGQGKLFSNEELGPIERPTGPQRSPQGTFLLAQKEAPEAARFQRGARGIVGRTISDPKVDFPAIMRYLSDATVEYHAYIVVDANGRITHAPVVTTDSPVSTAGTKSPNDAAYIGRLLDRAGRGAQLYGLHNHPSGSPRPSGVTRSGEADIQNGGDLVADWAMYRHFRDTYAGSAILAGDTGKFTWVDVPKVMKTGRVKGAVTVREFGPQRTGERARLSRWIDHPVLDKSVATPEEGIEVFEALAKQYGGSLTHEGSVALLYMGADGNVVGAEIVPSNLLRPKLVPLRGMKPEKRARYPMAAGVPPDALDRWFPGEARPFNKTTRESALSIDHGTRWLRHRLAETGAAAAIGWGEHESDLGLLTTIASGSQTIMGVLSPEGRYFLGQADNDQYRKKPYGIQQQVVHWSPDAAGTDITNPLRTANLTPEEQQFLATYIKGNEDRILGARGGVQNAQAIDRRALQYVDKMAATADELGVPLLDLMKRRGGIAMSAAELDAGKGLLSEAVRQTKDLSLRAMEEGATEQDVAAFLDAFRGLQSVTDQFFKARAEWGRAGQVLQRDAMDFDEARRLISHAGGMQSVQDLAHQVATLPPEAQAQFAQAAKKKTIGQSLWGLWYSAMLSNPKTHVVNFLGNTTYNTFLGLDRLVAAGLGKLHGGEKAYFTEMVPTLHGLAQGTLDALAASKDYLLTGGDNSKWDMPGSEAEKLGVTNAIPRMMGAGDAFFHSVAFHQELRRLALRQGIQEGLSGKALAERETYLREHPDEFKDGFRAAEKYAKKATFNADLTPWFRHLEGLRGEKTAPIAGGLTRATIPFLRTIVNLTKQQTRHTPGLAALLPEWRADIRKGGAARDIAIAENLTGAGLMLLGYMLSESGGGTGAEPPDPGEAKLNRIEGQAQSVKVGDEWVGYNRMDPLGSILALGASIPMIAEDPDKVAASLEVAKEIMLNKTMMIGVVNAFDAMQSYTPGEGESKIKNYLGGMASTAVPAVVGEAARYKDPYARKQADEGFFGRTKGKIPGVRETLAPQVDVRGDPVPRQEFWGPDLISPFPSKKVTAKPDVVLKEMRRLGYVPRDLKSVNGRKLPPKVASFYQMLARKDTWPTLSRLVYSPAYEAEDDEGKKDMIQKALAASNKRARADIRDLIPEEE